jgi:hypothetical protein
MKIELIIITMNSCLLSIIPEEQLELNKQLLVQKIVTIMKELKKRYNVPSMSFKMAEIQKILDNDEIYQNGKYDLKTILHENNEFIIFQEWITKNWRVRLFSDFDHRKYDKEIAKKTKSGNVIINHTQMSERPFDEQQLIYITMNRMNQIRNEELTCYTYVCLTFGVERISNIIRNENNELYYLIIIKRYHKNWNRFVSTVPLLSIYSYTTKSGNSLIRMCLAKDYSLRQIYDENYECRNAYAESYIIDIIRDIVKKYTRISLTEMSVKINEYILANNVKSYDLKEILSSINKNDELLQLLKKYNLDRYVRNK